MLRRLYPGLWDSRRHALVIGVRRSKAKNAQEAHEAVRPTDAQRQPGALPVAEPRLRRLYDLIWRRTLACQMCAARIRQVGATVGI
jgi:DNA topoisomerase I